MTSMSAEAKKDQIIKKGEPAEFGGVLVTPNNYREFYRMYNDNMDLKEEIIILELEKSEKDVEHDWRYYALSFAVGCLLGLQFQK